MGWLRTVLLNVCNVSSHLCILHRIFVTRLEKVNEGLCARWRLRSSWLLRQFHAIQKLKRVTFILKTAHTQTFAEDLGELVPMQYRMAVELMTWDFWDYLQDGDCTCSCKCRVPWGRSGRLFACSSLRHHFSFLLSYKQYYCAGIQECAWA